MLKRAMFLLYYILGMFEMVTFIMAEVEALRYCTSAQNLATVAFQRTINFCIKREILVKL